MLIDKVNLINPIKINISLFHSPHSVIVSHQLCPIELNLTLAIVTTGVSVSLCRDQANSGSDAHSDPSSASLFGATSDLWRQENKDGRDFRNGSVCDSCIYWE